MCGARALITWPLATRRGHRLGIFKSRQMLFPIRRQLAADCLLPERAEFCIFLCIALDQFFPLVFLFRAAVDRLAKMRQRFVGHIELLVFGPAQMPLGFAHRFFAGRIAVGFARAGRGHAVANGRLDGNQVTGDRRPTARRELPLRSPRDRFRLRPSKYASHKLQIALAHLR